LGLENLVQFDPTKLEGSQTFLYRDPFKENKNFAILERKSIFSFLLTFIAISQSYDFDSFGHRYDFGFLSHRYNFGFLSRVFADAKGIAI
jgi:hypothetical protein